MSAVLNGLRIFCHCHHEATEVLLRTADWVTGPVRRSRRLIYGVRRYTDSSDITAFGAIFKPTLDNMVPWNASYIYCLLQAKRIRMTERNAKWINWECQGREVDRHSFEGWVWISVMCDTKPWVAATFVWNGVKWISKDFAERILGFTREDNASDKMKVWLIANILS